MDQKSLFLQFWRHEAVATRKVISRIPQEMSDYRPHPRSRTAREIAWLFVVEERLLVEGLERGVLDLAGSDAELRPAEVWDHFVGEGYGIPTDASREALALLARNEAIVVDHTYTAKALAGLIALVREGSLPATSSILFWHTGGQVGVLA